jgi:hypothetical protein
LYLQLAVLQALVGQQFLEESASQLTYHGLCELNAKMGHGELAVFFRNNHFSTIYKQVSHWIFPRSFVLTQRFQHSAFRKKC